MAVKKIKISATKRANHLKGKKKISKTSNKPVAENILKKSFSQSSTHKRPKKNQIQKSEQRPVQQSDSENEMQLFESVQDIIDNGDNDNFLNITEIPTKRQRKRKNNELDNPQKASKLEKEYTSQQYVENKTRKVVVDLLPIKSKGGEIVTRSVEMDYVPKLTSDDNDLDGDEDEGEAVDSDEDIVEDIAGRQEPTDENASQRIISTADLLIQREQELERQKYRIGIICSGILEKPEDKMKNFSALFDLIEEYNKNGTRNLFSVRKLAILSIGEVFKDILPEYRVGQVDTKMTTVRKTTLERITFETALLQQFKKFLQKAEKIVSCITKKGGPQKTPENVKLAEVMVDSLCEILLSHPYFNYVKNIAQLLSYLLNCRFRTVREKINQTFKELFNVDQKLDMTLFIIRRINFLIKKRSNDVHVEMIDCLLALNIKDVDLDAEKQKELKQKKLEAHRQRLISMSKKERKRWKKLKEVNRDLEETKAEENKQTKLTKLTDITKMVFTIYFRLLKNDPNSKLLSSCLEGLAKFAHVINIEFFSDLIEILNRLLDDGELGYREQLHCIETIFIILSGQGEMLNIDPIRFYGHLYRNLYVVSAGKNHEDFVIILRCLNEVLIKRKKHISHHRLCAYIKRVITLSLFLLHNGTLAALGVVKNIMQMSNNLDNLLDTDSLLGSGRYDPELDDPEFCNSVCTSLYELSILQKHYHPMVRQIAQHITLGTPTTGEGILPPTLGKLSAEEMFTQYDSSQVTFNPPIPPPKPAQPKVQKGRYIYSDISLEEHCSNSLRNQNRNAQLIDFRHSFRDALIKKKTK